MNNERISKISSALAGLLIFFSVMAMATVPVLAQSASATRDIEVQTLAPGQSTNITVTITNNVSQGLSLDEDIPAGWNLTQVSDDANKFKNSTNEWVWFSVGAGVTKTVIYNLEVPSDAIEDNYNIAGVISNASGEIDTVKGEGEITVSNLTISDYYRSLGEYPDVVETTDILTAADDWSNDVTPPGFTEPITTQELLQLAEEWAIG